MKTALFCFLFLFFMGRLGLWRNAAAFFVWKIGRLGGFELSL